MEADIRKLQSINDALKRNKEHGKKMRNEKRIVSERLYKTMKRHGFEEYGGIKIKNIEPKPKAVRKKLKHKKSDAVALFSQVGIPDPEGFWMEFQETQKYRPEE
jgi:hypothetical protein